MYIVYFTTVRKNRFRQNRHFSLVVNDTFHNKGENHVSCSRSESGKVRFSRLRC